MNLVTRTLVITCIAALLAGSCVRQPSGRVTIGGTTSAGTPGEAMWLGFKQRAEQSSGGRLHIRTLIYGQLGSEEQLLAGLRRGRIQYANLSAQIVSGVVPELILLYSPFLFDNEAEADFVYDRHLTPLFSDLLAARGLHLVTWYEIGFHHVYARDRPVLVPDDARGRRFRIASSLSAQLFAAALGADAIPLGFVDIVPSLQTGLIEAGENSVSLYSRTGIAGEAPHLTLTAHSLGMSLILAHKPWWDELPEADRRVLTESFPAIGVSRAAVRAQTAADLAGADDLGIVVHELGPGERAAWQRATAGVTATLIARIGGRAAGVYDVIERGKQEFARQQRALPGTPGPGTKQ